ALATCLLPSLGLWAFACWLFLTPSLDHAPQPPLEAWSLVLLWCLDVGAWSFLPPVRFPLLRPDPEPALPPSPFLRTRRSPLPCPRTQLPVPPRPNRRLDYPEQDYGARTALCSRYAS